MDIGLIAFVIANVVFILLPFLDRNPMNTAPAHKRPVFKYWFWILVADMIVLTVYGKLPPTGANAWVGFGATIVFITLFIVLPIITKMEANCKCNNGGCK